MVEDLVGHLQGVPRRNDLPRFLAEDGGLVPHVLPAALSRLVSVMARHRLLLLNRRMMMHVWYARCTGLLPMLAPAHGMAMVEGL